MIRKSNNILGYSWVYFKKYIGKHIAIVDNKVVAIGNNRLSVYKKAIKNIPKNKKVGIYYLPLKKEIVTAL